MQGMMTVFQKELADHFASLRFLILFLLVLFAGIFTIWVDVQNIRGAVTESSQFIFLKLYTTSDESLPGLLQFLSLIAVFFVPIVGIALGFDAINNERNNGTLSRLLSQPIFRDSVINGKFLAGIVTISITLVSIVLLVGGFGLRMIGVPPSSEEVIRLIAFLGISIIYGGFWLGLAILFSVFFRRVATSILASIAVWLFFIFFMPMISGLIANAIVPIEQGASQELILRNASVQITAAQFSPITLYQQAVTVLLVPGARTLGQTIQLLSGSGAWLLPNPLSLGQSLLTAWPHLVSLIALTVICFAISYMKFMREEIRAT